MAHALESLPSAFFIRKTIQKENNRLKKPLRLREIAKHLGVTPAYVSLVVHGQRRLSMKRAVQLSYLLKMNDRDRNRFLFAVSVEATQNPDSKLVLKRLREGRSRSKRDSGDPFLDYAAVRDTHPILSKWYHVAILDLVTCSNFVPDPTWIARRLEISEAEVESALQTLFRHRLLETRGTRWRKANSAVYIPAAASPAEARDFLAQTADQTRAALKKTTSSEINRRSISVFTLAVNPAKLEQAKAMVNRFQDELMDLLTEGECTEVYQLGVQLFPLTTHSGELS